jgi:phage terminase small subunit
MPRQTSKPALTDKQARFVAEYLVDLNATAAAKRAGYSGTTVKNTAYELLHRPHVQEALTAAMQARAARIGVTADRVLQELARVAFFDARKLLNADGSLKAITDLDDDTAGALAGLDVLEEFAGSGEDRKLIGYTKKVKLPNKVEALGLAMKHLGMLRERVEHSGPNGGPIPVARQLSDADLEAIILRGRDAGK